MGSTNTSSSRSRSLLCQVPRKGGSFHDVKAQQTQWGKWGRVECTRLQWGMRGQVMHRYRDIEYAQI